MTPKREKFVDEYLIDLNATQAAIRAGYSARTAEWIGPKLLTKSPVQQAIAKRREELRRSTQITQERILLERARLAFFDVRKLLDNTGRPLPIHDLDDDTAAAIAGIDVVNIGNDEVGLGQVIKLKLADKGASLTALERHLGMYKDTGGDSAPLHIHLHL
jgi:phage terminase small subunit